MDTKIAALSGILVMILVGSGLLIVLDNPTDEEINDSDKEVIEDSVEEVNLPPIVMFSEYVDISSLASFSNPLGQVK